MLYDYFAYFHWAADIGRGRHGRASKLAELRGKLLLIEGGLIYDNVHFVNGDADNPLPSQPKRFSLWEIHPVTSVKVCKKTTVSQCDPDRASDWNVF